jgi:heavy metal sensor kinase
LSFRPRSVRLRLTLWYAGALALLLAAFSGTVYVLVRASLLHEVEERAEQSLAVMERLLVDDPSGIDEIEEHGVVTCFAVLVPGEAARASTGWRREGLPDPATVAARSGNTRVTSGSGRRFATAHGTHAGPAGPLTIVVAVDEEPVLAHLRTLALVLLVGFPAAIVGAVVGGSLLAKRALAPVGTMADAAARITAERLSERLPVGNADDEFGRLASVFNQTLARLEDAFERLRRFTADASHELRTPLTALRSVGEVALRAPDFHASCRDTVESMLEESERLTRLVDELLMLTRESTEAYRARFAPVDVGELTRGVVELFRALAEEKGQRISVAVECPHTVTGDASTLRHALINLVDNAVKYTPRGGSIAVAVRANQAGDVLVEVADTGPGIAPEHHAQVFERFYRVDEDRSRITGGAGLGLAIARWAADLNGGTVELDSTPGAGSTFRLRVPSGLAITSNRATGAGPTLPTGGRT